MTQSGNAATGALVERWLDLWNGNLSIADTLVAEDFLTHTMPLTPGGDSEMRGRDALKQWISGGLRAALPDLCFSIAVGPIATDDYFALRWSARGTYGGGFPGASEEAVGSVITFDGTDIVRVVDGLLVEYWLNADLLEVFIQLGDSAPAGAQQA
jgi:hypothetical protein